jgi:hypothetical protein
MTKEILRKVSLNGLTDIMFDRYAGDNQTELPPERKWYFLQDGKTLMLPSANILSFLSAQNTDSAPKRFADPRKYKKLCQAFLSYTSISPFEIPFLREGKRIVFDGFSKEAGMYIDDRVARLNKGIPNHKIRPVLALPWGLEFTITVFPNDEFNEDMLYNMFVKGGIAIGLGTYRGVFGKFEVKEWE